jgi:hypothetical protein
MRHTGCIKPQKRKMATGLGDRMMVKSLHMLTTQTPDDPARSPSRPFRVTLLAVGVLTIASLYLIRLVEALYQWRFLNSLAGVSPVYLALTGLIWASVGLPLFWGLWRGRARAAKFVPGYLLVFALYYWLDRIWIANRAVSLTNWPFTAALTIIGLAYTFWALRTRASKIFFAK